MNLIKYNIKCLIRFILRFFYIIPLKKKTIFFESFDGNELCCSPFYIFEYMRKNTTGYTFIISSKIKKENYDNVRFVKTKSFAWVLAQIYSETQVINTGFKVFIPYRKKQILINTWHGGGAYKRVGIADKSAEDIKYLTKSNNYVNSRLSYFISSSKEFSKVMKESLLIPENKFLNIGLPRNDIFFEKDWMQKSNLMIRNKYKIPNNAFVVLYAPTYRGDMASANFDNQLDFNRLKTVLSTKLQQKIILAYRGHYFVNSNSTFDCVDFNWSTEANMQDLLCCANLLITDYSSSMWDFSYTGKPCFLFAPDFDSYYENRGFYTNPFDWGFPICKSNEDLENKLKSFNKEIYLKAIEKHHDLLGTYEHGVATRSIANIIIQGSI